MTSAVPPHPGVPPPASNTNTQPAAAAAAHPSSNNNAPPTPMAPSHQAASPPSKRDLKSWWKGFKLAPRHQDSNGEHDPSGPGEPSTPPYNYYKTLPPASYRQATVFSEAVGSRLLPVPGEATTSSETLKGPQVQPTASCVSLPSSGGHQTTQTTSCLRQLQRTLGGCLPSAPPHAKKHEKKREAKLRPQADSKGPGIFGVPLRQSITYANVAISLVDDDGKSYIYGYVPIVVAKCGVFLKEKATGVEGIFRLSGSEKRIKELKQIFDSPDRYGKGLNWEGYTVHDAANVLRRYLNDLPEPVVPLDLYEKFREPLRGAMKQTAGDAEGPQFAEDFDLDRAIREYQRLITELPPLNRQLLLYILDLLAVFAAKADENRMTSQNLAAIFQPGMLSHPAHAMAPEEYRLNQCVIIFLIENQDHFLIGMQGTAADEKTVQEVQNGTPPVSAPVTPLPSRKSGVHRSASNASAGAESVAREGMVRRNRSTSSRHSRQSTGGPSPGSPALAATPTGGLGRSNTVPSKKSPALQSARFQKRGEHSPAPVSPMTPVVVHTPAPPTVEEVPTPESGSEAPAPRGASPALAQPRAEARAQDRLLLEPQPEAATPSRERNLQSLFQRSPGGDGEKRAPNKLRKKRIPGSANPSAQSSTVSLPHSVAASPAVEMSNPLEEVAEPADPEVGGAGPAGPKPAVADETPSEPTPRASQLPPQNNLHPASAESPLRPSKKSPPTSLHSSYHEGSDADQVEELPAPAGLPEHSEAQQDREKKRRWRLSRKKEDMAGAAASPVTSPRRVLGDNTNAEMSTSTVGSSSQKPRRSFTGEPPDPALISTEALSSQESGSRERDGARDDGRGLTGWIKSKYREHRESAEQRRNKSPPADRPATLSAAALLPVRGKSLDLHRPAEGEAPPPVQPPPPPPPPPKTPGQPAQQPQPPQGQAQQQYQAQQPQAQQPQPQQPQPQQPQPQQQPASSAP